MTELATQHCEACRPGTPPLTEAEAEAMAQPFTGWSRDANRSIKREFSFKNFRRSFAFVTEVALLAESEGHHPDLELGWGRAVVSFTTHAASGLTRNDFIMAAKVDRLLQT